MKKQTGFVLTLVIFALIMVGVAMFVLTGGSNAMLFHADTAYLQAVDRNLTASGLAWARAKVSGGWDPNDVQPHELDTAGFSAPGSKLTLQMVESQGDRAKVHIQTFCRKGRHNLQRSRDFVIERP